MKKKIIIIILAVGALVGAGVLYVTLFGDMNEEGQGAGGEAVAEVKEESCQTLYHKACDTLSEDELYQVRQYEQYHH